MGSVTSGGLRYPASTDAPNVPQDFQNLALDVQTYFAPLKLPTLTNPTLISPLENALIQASAATGTITVYAVNNGVVYYTLAATGTFVLNITGTSTTTLNSYMGIGQVATVAFITATGGSNAYYLTSFQIDGTPVTPKWANGSTPASSSTNGFDVYEFSIIKTGVNAYTVVANQGKFS